MATSCATLRLAPESVRNGAEHTFTNGEEPRRTVRGVGWVLCWAAAMAILSWASLTLVAFAYQMAAERTLTEAAQAGIREAALPRATHRSVTESVRRRLAASTSLDRSTTIRIERNGWLVRGLIRPNGGDQLTVTLRASFDAALPRWLTALTPWQRPGEITVRVENPSARG